MIGKRGVAITLLRPAGTVKIDRKRYSVVTQGEYIEKGKEIEIIEVEGNRVVVKEATNS